MPVAEVERHFYAEKRGISWYFSRADRCVRVSQNIDSAAGRGLGRGDLMSESEK